MFDRLISLVGKDNFDKISNTKILLIGLGGVGGYSFESLVRSGINNITIADYDKIDITNLNRQIITNSNNIGELKTSVALKRAKDINPNINIHLINEFIDENTINIININEFDYIIDSCDSINTKSLLINKAFENNVKIISSMGMANRMDPTKIKITTLNKTTYDPLAKKLRKLVDKEIQKKTIVITSEEEALKREVLASNSFVPSTAGLMITSYIINDIIKEVR